MMEISEMQKQSFEVLEAINKKLDIKHDPDKIFFSLVEEVGEVSRELSKKQSGFRDEFDKEKLGFELADILSRTAVIATDHGVDLSEAFENKMKKIKERFELR